MKESPHPLAQALRAIVAFLIFFSLISFSSLAHAQLSNGVALNGLSGEDDSQARYFIDVPAGASNLNIAISGNNGDADLYVKRDSQPTYSSYDCRPWLDGSNESCGGSSLATQAGRYHIMIDGYESYTNLKLVASYTSPGGGSGACTAAAVIPYWQAAGGSWQNSTSVSINAGQNLRFGPQPTSGSYQWAGPGGYTSASREATVNNIS